MLIDQIAQSLSEMSTDELYDHIKSIRKARRVPTKIPRGSRPVKTPSLDKMQSLLDSLPKEALAGLLAELEES